MAVSCVLPFPPPKHRTWTERSRKRSWTFSSRLPGLCPVFRRLPSSLTPTANGVPSRFGSATVSLQAIAGKFFRARRSALMVGVGITVCRAAVTQRRAIPTHIGEGGWSNLPIGHLGAKRGSNTLETSEMPTPPSAVGGSPTHRLQRQQHRLGRLWDRIAIRNDELDAGRPLSQHLRGTPVALALPP
jgi:hypothetical protein